MLLKTAILAAAAAMAAARPAAVGVGAPPAAPASQAVIEPVPMSDVALTGEWKQKEVRNQEVLMSLNHTQWACHFTTAANLTKCVAASARWLTYVKSASNPGNYTLDLGFIAAGNDVKPAANATVAACKAYCTGSAACKAVSFQLSEADENKTDTLVHCYWKSVSGFTPTPRSNCIADGGADKPTCSPLPGEMGLGGYYGHYQGHWMSATAFLFNTTGNETIKAAAAKNVAKLAAVMAAWKAKYGYDGYIFPYDPVVFDKLLAGKGAYPYYSVPFYTLHKIMAGLLDQYLYAGNEQAFELVQKMGGWVHWRVEETIASGGEPLWQHILGTEWGGMNDVLYNLYERTGNTTYLKAGRRFNGYIFTARLAAGIDDLAHAGFPHANMHLPEIIGNARGYELTGNMTDKKIVDTFFNVLSTNHSYATAGSNSGECWQDPRDLGNFLDSQTEESCTQYNVLKVARRSFMTSANASLADFYERAILNGIIGNQNREDSGATSYIYMQPLGGANVKPWGKSDFGFPCCWGTLSESFAKLGDSIFFWQPASKSKSGTEALYINQFVSATVKLSKLPGTVSVVQEAHFPLDATKTVTLTVKGGGKFDIMVRVPDWAKSSSNAVAVNKVAVAGAPYSPGSYLKLSRTWKDGDVIDVSYPMHLWTEPLNDYHAIHNATLAFMYGPLVLAGVHMDTDVWMPKGGYEAAKTNPAAFIRRNSSTTLDFEATAANGTKIQMIPLKEVMSEKYVAYFMTAGTKPPQPHNGYCPHSSGEQSPRGKVLALHGRHAQVTSDDAVDRASGGEREDSSVHGLGVTWSLAGGRIEPGPVAPTPA